MQSRRSVPHLVWFMVPIAWAAASWAGSDPGHLERLPDGRWALTVGVETPERVAWTTSSAGGFEGRTANATVELPTLAGGEVKVQTDDGSSVSLRALGIDVLMSACRPMHDRAKRCRSRERRARPTAAAAAPVSA